MQRYFAIGKEQDHFLLSPEDHHHIAHVMRFRVGDHIQVVFERQAYLCVLEENQIKTLQTLEQLEENTLEIILLLPLLKEQKMDFVLQKATELGVSKIIPVLTERSIVKLDPQRIEKKIERWTKICKEASEQSYRTTIPEITRVCSYQELPTYDGLKLICSTKERQKSLRSSLQHLRNYDRIVIAIGPEGGLTDQEEETLVEQGYKRISLGRRILRVETVPIVLLGILNYEMMED